MTKKKHKPKYNLFISPIGNIRTRPTDDLILDAKLGYAEGNTPLALTTVQSDRKVLISLYNNRKVKLSPEAKEVIYKALNESRKPPPPILKPTDYELVGWIDRFGKLTAKKNQPTKPSKYQGDWPMFRPGGDYTFRRFEIGYKSRYTKSKLHSNVHGEMSVIEHDMELSGRDAGYQTTDQSNKRFMFRDNPRTPNQIRSEWVWKFFDKPYVETVSEKFKKEYNHALEILDDAEVLNGTPCYPGQRHYIASISCTDGCGVFAETGAGKSFIAIMLDQIKNPARTLLIAPKGTVKDDDGNETDYDPAQWIEEFAKFNPDRKIFPLFSLKDYHGILERHGGRLPPGVYISYPQAYFTGGGSFEGVPSAWSRGDYEEKFRKRFGYRWEATDPPQLNEYISTGIGETRNGITCIYKPSLATLTRSHFDMMIVDEAHLMCNPKSQVTRSLIRMQPKFRYCLTATPIPNIVYNIFPLLGWMAQDKFFHGDVSSVKWPYSYNEYGKFGSDFTSSERDLTEEEIRAREGRAGGGTRKSPIISQAQRLLMLVKPVAAHITKEDCNPDIVDCEVNTVRVPFGQQQKKLYAHNLQIRNIPFKNPRTKYGVQMTRLRGICSDPLGRSYNDEVVTSNFNPKIIAILEKMAELIAKGEQVIHVCAFQGMTDELAGRLSEAGITYSRIDGKAKHHVIEANRFKRGETRVLLMGIKCAQAHSFANCRNLIIGSLEWSYGSFNQAMGRIYRLNSPDDVRVYVILNKDSIDEMMFDKVATKRDAATIVLHGKMVDSGFKSVSTGEIFAEHFLAFDEDTVVSKSEEDCEDEWPKLLNKLGASNCKKWKEVEVSCN